MTAIKELRDEIEKRDGFRWANDDHAVLSPIFWQSLGKARGWSKSGYEEQYFNCGDLIAQRDGMTKAEYQWHQFIDHLASGKDAKGFFASLTNK